MSNIIATPPKVWTTDTLGNENGSSSTANLTDQNYRQHYFGGNPYYIGIQSRFRRKYFHKIIFLILILIIIGLVIGIIIVAGYRSYSATRCETKDCIRAAANLLETMDQTADPCEDFYQFTCGNWHQEHPRPDSSSSYDWFAERQKKVLRNVREFLAANETKGDLPVPIKQTKWLYAACMDTEKLNVLGIAPIMKYLKEYNLPEIPTYFNITDTDFTNYKFDWILSLVKIKRSFGADLMIGFDVFPDPTNRTVNRIAMGTPEAGSELPFNTDVNHRINRVLKSKALNEDENAADDSPTLVAYYAYISEIMAAVITHSNPQITIESYAKEIDRSAKYVVKTAKFIYKLAQEAENLTKTDKQDALADLRNVYVVDLQNITDSYLAPKKPIPIWKNYINLMFQNITNVTVNLKEEKILSSKSDLKYLEMLTEFISNSSLVELELYIWWTIVEELVLHTTSEIRELHYQYSKTVTNLEGSVSRSLYCSGGVNQLMGMAVSYSIVDKDFSAVTKPKVELMLRNIRESFDDLVMKTNWMDVATQKQTLEKSMEMKSFIGFPEWILNKTRLEAYYKGLKINETTHLDNMMGVLKWQMEGKLKDLYKLNEFGWATSPTNVNAFHTFQANTITIPLAMLQYPFYHLGLEALNYGSIGTVLGHELTHGFDDSGRQFDKNGNMRQWWTNTTVTEYVNRTTCFVKQYSDYYLDEVSEYINGELTLGENIADNGGLREAYYGYRKYVEENGKEPKLPGLEHFTHEQLFFISFGNLWCESSTVQATRWALEDSHCPGRIRLKGVLQNSHEFAEIFKCKNGTGMAPTQNRCRIW